MATQAYYDWLNDGSPFTLATPVKMYRDALRINGWDTGTLGDTAHLTASVPKDHCPFSFTGWPVKNPYPYVLAIDLMHHPERGEDVGPVVDYWLAEARAGRTPWVKYIIWQAKSYDVRNGWAARDAEGHFDHVHVSMRTDHVSTFIGSWNVLPDKGNGIQMLCMKGDKGSHVEALQVLLRYLGREEIVVDGDYGVQTSTAVRELAGFGNGEYYGPTEWVIFFIKLAEKFGKADPVTGDVVYAALQGILPTLRVTQFIQQ